MPTLIRSSSPGSDSDGGGGSSGESESGRPETGANAMILKTNFTGVIDGKLGNFDSDYVRYIQGSTL
jgi:hypothetical protein